MFVREEGGRYASSMPKEPPVSDLIVLPTAKLHCECGKRLAPNLKAAARMGLPSFASAAYACECGKQVIREVEPTARREPATGDKVCSCCGLRPSGVRIEIQRNIWKEWCLDCLEEYDELTDQRFGAYLKPVK